MAPALSLPSLESSRSFLLFRRGAQESRRLADVSHGCRLVPAAIAARAAAYPPTEPDETPYEGVSCALVEPSSPPLAIDSPGTPEAAVRALRAALRETVERTLEGARSVAVLAGGGLDSGGLLALAVEWARARGARVFAVALDFGGPASDRPYLRMLEESLGCEVVRIEPEAAAAFVSSLDGVDAAPFSSPSDLVEVALLAQARASGADCVLMGVGGDELFDGEPRSLSALVRSGRLREAVRAARSLRGFARPRSRSVSWLVRPLVADAAPVRWRIRRARGVRPVVPGWAGPALAEYIEGLHGRAVTTLARTLPDGLVVDPANHERQRANQAWMRHQKEIASGIERRDPFFDRGLIRFVESLPPEWLLAGGIRRGLFREALRDLLPAPLLDREDKAFFEPAFLRAITPAGGLEAFRDLATVRELGDLGIVAPERFREAFDGFLAAPERGEGWTEVWPILAVERFLRARRRAGS